MALHQLAVESSKTCRSRIDAESCGKNNGSTEVDFDSGSSKSVLSALLVYLLDCSYGVGLLTLIEKAIGKDIAFDWLGEEGEPAAFML